MLSWIMFNCMMKSGNKKLKWEDSRFIILSILRLWMNTRSRQERTIQIKWQKMNFTTMNNFKQLVMDQMEYLLNTQLKWKPCKDLIHSNVLPKLSICSKWELWLLQMVVWKEKSLIVRTMHYSSTTMTSQIEFGRTMRLTIEPDTDMLNIIIRN